MPQVIFLPHAEHCPDGMVVEAEVGKSFNVPVNTRWLDVVPCWINAAGVSAERPWAISCSQIIGKPIRPM